MEIECIILQDWRKSIYTTFLLCSLRVNFNGILTWNTLLKFSCLLITYTYISSFHETKTTFQKWNSSLLDFCGFIRKKKFEKFGVKREIYFTQMKYVQAVKCYCITFQIKITRNQRIFWVFHQSRVNLAYKITKKLEWWKSFLKFAYES